MYRTARALFPDVDDETLGDCFHAVGDAGETFALLQAGRDRRSDLSILAADAFFHRLADIRGVEPKLALMVETFLATHTLGTFKMSHFKIGPTELRILLAIGNLVLLVHPMAELFGHQYRLFDVSGVIAIGGMLFTLVFAAAVNTRALYRAEPLPRKAA